MQGWCDYNPSCGYDIVYVNVGYVNEVNVLCYIQIEMCFDQHFHCLVGDNDDHTDSSLPSSNILSIM